MHITSNRSRSCAARRTCTDGVIEFDVSDHDLDGYNKFIPYYLFPESVYSVGVSQSPLRAKVSVGTNPWTQARTPAQSGQALRAVRRRRPRRRRRHFFQAG